MSLVKIYNHTFLGELSNYFIPTVPDITVTEFNWNSIEELQELARGKYAQSKKDREGIVIRAVDDSPYILPPEPEMHGCWSFKIINPDYSLGKKD